jgi:hypothetical protein
MGKKTIILIFLLGLLFWSFTALQMPISSIFGLDTGSYLVVHQPAGNTVGILVDSLYLSDKVEYQIEELTSRDSVFADTLNPYTSEAMAWASENVSEVDKRRGAVISYSCSSTNSRDFIWQYVVNKFDTEQVSFMLVSKKDRVSDAVFVDKKFGNNGSALREYVNFPYQNLWSATQFAESGDVVVFKDNSSYSIGAIASGADYEYLSTNEVSLLRTGISSIKLQGNNCTISSTLADPVFFNVTTSGKTVDVNNLNFNKLSFKNCTLTGSSVVFNNCNFNTTDTSAIKFVNTLSDTTGFVVFKNCTFTSTHAAASPIFYSQSSTVRVFFYGCKFIGKDTVSEILSNGTVASDKIFFDANCTTNSITVNGSVTYSGGTLTRNAAYKL